MHLTKSTSLVAVTALSILVTYSSSFPVRDSIGNPAADPPRNDCRFIPHSYLPPKSYRLNYERCVAAFEKESVGIPVCLSYLNFFSDNKIEYLREVEVKEVKCVSDGARFVFKQQWDMFEHFMPQCASAFAVCKDSIQNIDHFLACYNHAKPTCELERDHDLDAVIRVEGDVSRILKRDGEFDNEKDMLPQLLTQQLTYDLVTKRGEVQDPEIMPDARVESCMMGCPGINRSLESCKCTSLDMARYDEEIMPHNDNKLGKRFFWMLLPEIIHGLVALAHIGSFAGVKIDEAVNGEPEAEDKHYFYEGEELFGVPPDVFNTVSHTSQVNITNPVNITNLVNFTILHNFIKQVKTTSQVDSTDLDDFNNLINFPNLYKFIDQVKTTNQLNTTIQGNTTNPVNIIKRWEVKDCVPKKDDRGIFSTVEDILAKPFAWYVKMMGLGDRIKEQEPCPPAEGPFWPELEKEFIMESLDPQILNINATANATAMLNAAANATTANATAMMDSAANTTDTKAADATPSIVNETAKPKIEDAAPVEKRGGSEYFKKPVMASMDESEFIPSADGIDLNLIEDDLAWGALNDIPGALNMTLLEQTHGTVSLPKRDDPQIYPIGPDDKTPGAVYRDPRPGTEKPDFPVYSKPNFNNETYKLRYWGDGPEHWKSSWWHLYRFDSTKEMEDVWWRPDQSAYDKFRWIERLTWNWKPVTPFESEPLPPRPFLDAAGTHGWSEEYWNEKIRPYGTELWNEQALRRAEKQMLVEWGQENFQAEFEDAMQ